jgi:hypothetical protein
MTAAGDPLIRRQLNTPDQVYSAGDDAPIRCQGSIQAISESTPAAAHGAGGKAGQPPLAPGRDFET